jgi:PTS system mannitol-specific IIC component
VIQFFGGIHEVYFPYALMKPILILALIAGGMTGVTTNMLLGGALRAPAAPGSIIAVLAQVANNSYLAVILSVILSAAVTFLIAAVILRASRKRDLEAMAVTDDAFGAAITQTEAAKGKSSDALTNLRGGAATQTDGGIEPATMTERHISNIVFACDAGMGSSAMGASVLRNKIKKAGVEGVTVVNKAIANLDSSADLVITQNQLTDRARQQTPNAIHVSVDNFMNSPKYDEVVDLVRDQQEDGS